MLTYKISTRDIKQDVQAVSLNENTVYIGEETIIVPSSNNGLRANDFITFIRNDGDDIHYTEKVTVSDVLEDSFSIPKFSEKLLPIYNAGIVETKYHPNKNKRKFLVLLLTDDKHDFVEYRQDERYGANAAYIKEYIYDDYSAYIENMKRCNGDHILYEGVFLYTATVDAERHTDRPMTGEDYYKMNGYNRSLGSIFDVPRDSPEEFRKWIKEEKPYGWHDGGHQF